MKPVLVSEAELEALYDEENEDFLAGARAVLEDLGVMRVVDVPADLHDDFLPWKELRKGPVLVRLKKPAQG